NKAQASLTGTAGLERLVGMNAASGRKRASNTAACLRLHRVGAPNPRLGVRGGWLQDEQRRHSECRSPFVAVHNSRSLCSLVTVHYSMRLKSTPCLAARASSSHGPLLSQGDNTSIIAVTIITLRHSMPGAGAVHHIIGSRLISIRS